MALFICTHCDAQYPKWQGQCAECGKWGMVKEDTPQAVSVRRAGVQSLRQVQRATVVRSSAGGAEVDRVLGGGLVPGSLVLLTGEPGIGKSTLVLQIARHVQERGNVLYVSGEESQDQVARRADRLGIASDRILLLPESDIDIALAAAEQHQPALLIIDSLQTAHTGVDSGEPGSVGQIRAVGAKLTGFARKSKTPVLLIGHVTKEGTAAGPKTLEHLVDVVLVFEGDHSYPHRLLRSLKNRFGPSGEVGVFTMGDQGLQEVANPSEFFLNLKRQPAPGTVICPIVEGSRVFCVDVQALVERSTYSTPRRTASGFDSQRLQVLLAVLGKAAQGFQGFDVTVGIAGGLKVKEPAVDLAVCIAAISAKLDLPVPTDLAVFGEVGLQGEIRPVVRESERVRTAQKLGCQRILTGPGKTAAGVTRVASVGEAIRAIFSKA